MTHNLLPMALRFWLPPLLWMALISPVNPLWTSGNTSSVLIPILQWLFPYADEKTIVSVHLLIRKTSHFIEYGFLAFLLFRAFRGGRRDLRLAWILYAGAIAVCYGIFDEYMQSLIPSRTGSLYDWLIDSSGVVCILGIITVRRRIMYQGARLS
jgi:VanZ family protein